MKIIALMVLSCVLWEARGYPYYPYYGNMDSLAYGASDTSRGGMVVSRYYNPYYNPHGMGMAAFMVRQPEVTGKQQIQPSQYYVPDRRRQTPPEGFFPSPQENEVFYPPTPGKPIASTEQTEIAEATDRTEIRTTTVKAITPSVPELVEPEVEEVDQEQKSTKRVPKNKKVKPIQDDDDDETPKMPTGAFFPMFFGYGRNGGGSSPGGATAIANAYSTGRGGVATSHATAYGMPTPDFKHYHQQKNM